jgi:hypothetical protein
MEMSIEKAARNDITGDALVSKPTGRKFDNNFDGIDWSETFDPNHPTNVPASQPKEKIMSWTATVEQDKDGEYFIQFPDGLCDQMGWAVGDNLIWYNQNNGSWTFKKKVD